MRPALILGGMLTLLTATWAARSQAPSAAPVQGEKVITVPEVEVYSGPSTKLYATCKLARGARVIVLRQSEKDPNWLVIKPPEGLSFSWINRNFVQMNPGSSLGIVVTDPDVKVPVKVGSYLDVEPNVEGARLARGTLVTLLKPDPHFGRLGGDGAWLPIEPAPQEVRYLPAIAVQTTGGIQTVAAQAPAAPLGPPQTGTGDPTVQQLLQNLSPAQKQQLITALGGVPGAAPPGHPNNVASAPGYPTGQLVSAQPQPAAGTGQNQALYNSNPPGAAPAPSAAPAWSKWGKLSRASFQLSGQQAYTLLDPQGTLILYAVPEPGKTLDPYVGRTVALYGRPSYRSDEYMRAQFMTVSYVSPPQ